MSKIIPVNITTTEQAVALDATYQFVWLRNMGENDCLLSDHSGIVAGGDDVMTVKAGESGRISTSGKAVYVKAVSGTSTGEIHAQNFSDAPFKSKAKGGGQSITVEPLNVADNGVYTAPTGKAYSPITVDVQEQPWQPLQDGYSNFWFELTNDTLSPWLNFSAKTENAVIDWGDGSGEVALDTLSPTHTYAKAGRYVVKVKGVTGIERQQSLGYSLYNKVLKAVEFNSEILSITTFAFTYNLALENVSLYNTENMKLGTGIFSFCPLLKGIEIPSNITDIPNSVFYMDWGMVSVLMNVGIETIGASVFNNCVLLNNVVIPSTVTSIGNSAFQGCSTLNEIHISATVPPTLGTGVFNNLPSNFIIYVPVGYAEAYKAASGWSSYADHILEEGQDPTRAMLAKFNSTNTDNEEMR